MAYDKHTWTCREPITAEKLNHMEEGIANAGGDCDCGYECTETLTTLTEESVTTTAQGSFYEGYLSYSQLIDADTIVVTFDGVEYECPRLSDGDYGAPYDASTNTYDWSEYPFNVYDNTLSTETAGTYSVKIEAVESSVTTTACFRKAVASASSPLVVEASCAPSEGTVSAPSVLDASPSAIYNAMKTRGVVVEDPYGNLYSVLFATNGTAMIIASRYNASATPPTVLEPYLYDYDNGVLRYPHEEQA